MGLGLLYLISRGREDLYMVQNPDITFFKIVYKKHTNFSTENIDQYFKTIPDFGKKVTLNVSKNADLMGDIYLKVILPTIPVNNHPEIKSIKKFKWVKRIGLALIKYIDIEIGGILISRLYNDWLHIWHELTLKSGLKPGFNKIIGNIDYLEKLSDGKDSYELMIPINFWFTRESGLFLPLISIYQHEINIEIEFNEIENLYIESPNHYVEIDDNFVIFEKNEFIVQKTRNNINIIKFIHFDNLTKKLYFNKIKGDLLLDEKYQLIGENSKYSLTLNSSYIITKDFDYFNGKTPSIINSYMMINYIYLDNLERQIFRESDHQYLIELPQKITPRLVNNNIIKYKINLKNPNKLLIFYAKLYDNIKNNDYFNYSINPINNNSNNDIIEKVKLNINSIDRIEINNFKYFSLIEKFKSNFNNIENIGIYSFCLYPQEYQPSGTMNFSKVDDSYLELTLNQSISYNTPAEITAFGLEYNILRIINGLAGLAFYN
tara:strand:+ start:832 stop:2301 length:1470 start_codon:yes stop_codon:yes gene_type:complete